MLGELDAGAGTAGNRLFYLSTPAQAFAPIVTGLTGAGFGGCTNAGECTAVCPKGIPVTLIGRLNRDYRRAVTHRP